jgi:hypothetical protein
VPDEVATYTMDEKVFVGSGASNEVQVITKEAAGGTFTISFDGETTAATAYNASSTTVQTRLDALSNIESGDVVVSGSNGGPWTLTFGGQYAGTDVPAVTCDSTSLTGTNEVQTITVDAEGGTFTVTCLGDTTAALAFDVSAANLLTALRGLTAVDNASLTTSGGPGDDGGTTPYIVTFTGAHAATNVAEMTTDDTLLTGGDTGTAVVETTTPGVGKIAVPTTSTGGEEGESGVSIPDNVHADARSAVSGHATSGNSPEDTFDADD